MQPNKELETTIARGIVKASVWMFLLNLIVTITLAIIYYRKSDKQ